MDIGKTLPYSSLCSMPGSALPPSFGWSNMHLLVRTKLDMCQVEWPSVRYDEDCGGIGELFPVVDGPVLGFNIQEQQLDITTS